MTDVLDTDASLVDSFAPNISAETDLAPADDSIINNSDLTDGAEPVSFYVAYFLFIYI